MAAKNMQKYAVKVDFDFTQILTQVQNMKKQFSTINAGGSFATSFTKAFKEIEDKSNKFANTLSQGFTSSKELDRFILDLERFSNLLVDTGARLGTFKIDPKEFVDTSTEIKKLTKDLEKFSRESKLAKEAVKDQPTKLREVSGSKTETKSYERNVVRAAAAGESEQIQAATVAFLSYLDTKLEKLKEIVLIQESEYESVKNQNEEAARTITVLKEQAKIIRSIKKKDRTPTQQATLDTYSEAKKTERTTTPQIQKFDLSSLVQQAEQLETIFIPIAEKVRITTEKMTKAQNLLDKATREMTANAQKDIDNLKEPLENAAEKVDDLRDSVESVGDSTRNIENAKGALDKLGNSMKKFVGFNMLWNLGKRAIRGIWSDFKELDKQFNQIAIVTQYSTAQMWEGFNRVNQIAQKYGVTATNVVSVQKLYYQQGLKTAEVNRLTTETLTLAKITGMEYAEATDQMTAAIRAFRIESQDAAQITDTFAALAAGAAADAYEISNALNKTASIAASAGMTLQSTSVFLTKMIETTRESSENLGTAMKTIVARFGELKQNLAQVEVEGEIIDANKIDTALKTVGVSLRDTGGQFRDLDQVFMELSKKWDTLDRNTQRYIATTSAGSRQQSRFIAMMENYERTLELTNIAEGAAGTGKKQLATSMESIETSLNKLTSAWQDFYTNLIKSDMFKWFIDNLTSLLTALDKVPASIVLINAVLLTGLIPVLGKLIGAFLVAKLTTMENIKTIKMKTAAELEAIIVAKAKIGVTYSEAQAAQIYDALLKRNTISTETNTGAEMKNVLSKQKGVIAKVASWTVTKLQTLATKASTFATAVKTAADKGETVGLWAKITALIIEQGLKKIGIGLAIAAAVVIAGLVIAHKMEAAAVEKSNEATEKANTAIEKSNETRKNAVSTITTYNKALELHRKGLRRTAEEEETYQSLLKTLKEEMPDVVKAREDGTFALEENRKALDKLIELKEKELALNNLIIASNGRLAASYGQAIEGSPAEATSKEFYSRAATLGGQAEGTILYDQLKEIADRMKFGDIETLQEGLTKIGEGEFNAATLGLLTDEKVTTGQFKQLVSYFQNNPDGTLKDALKGIGEYSEGTLTALLDLNDLMDKYGVSLEGYLKEVTSQEQLDYLDMLRVGGVASIEAAAKGFSGEISDEINKALAAGVDTGFQTGERKTFDVGTYSGPYKERVSGATKTIDADALKKIVESSATLEDVKSTLTAQYGQMNFSEDLLDYLTRYYNGDLLIEQVKEAVSKITPEDFGILNELVTTSQEAIWSPEENAKAEKEIKRIFAGNESAQASFLSQLQDTNQAKLIEERKILLEMVKARGLTSQKIFDLDTNQLQTIKNYMDELGLRGQEFGNAFNSIITNLNDADTARFFQQFGSTNFESSDSVNELRKFSKELGVSTNQMESFISTFDEMYKREAFTFKSTVEQVTKDVGDIQKAVELLNAEAFKAEDIQTLMELDSTLSMENFELTVDGYRLIGTTTKEVLENKQAELKEQYRINILENKSAIAGLKKELAMEGITEEKRKQIELDIASLENGIALFTSAYAQIVSISNETSQGIKDAAKAARELLAALKDVLDLYSNINDIIEVLSQKGSLIDSQLEFTQNSQQKAKLIGEKLANSLQLTAAYSAMNMAAEENLRLYAESINRNYSDYLTFDKEGNLIENYEAITALYERQAAAVRDQNDEAAEYIETQISAIKDQASGYRSQKKLIRDNNQALFEQVKLQKELVDIQYQNIKTLEDKIISLLIERDEKHLEMIQDKYNAIKKADQDYLTSVQKVIQKERELRDRANTLTTYQEQLKRLALLKMDTSGVYAKEILELEKDLQEKAQEIADQRQDDLIQQEEENANYRAEKLDEEYDLRETTLKKNKELMTVYIDEVNELMLLSQEDLLNWLKDNDKEFITGTETAQRMWVEEWKTNVVNAKGAQETLAGALKPIQDGTDELVTTTKELNIATKAYFDAISTDKDGKATTIAEMAKAYLPLIGNTKKALDYLNALKEAMGMGGKKGTVEIPGSEEEHLNPGMEAFGVIDRQIHRKDPTWETIEGKEYYYDATSGMYLSKEDSKTYYINGIPWVGWTKDTTGYKTHLQAFLDYHRKGGNRYKEGGLVDYTGPAWVDGSKSKPESFLSSIDTANLFSLTQTLRSLFLKTPLTPTTSTENNSKIEINIQVGTLSNGYDVDQLTARVEENIVKASKKNAKITKINK